MQRPLESPNIALWFNISFQPILNRLHALTQLKIHLYTVSMLFQTRVCTLHLDWISHVYSGQRISWILANQPLMERLTELMAFEYFEQEGNVPIIMYQNWGTFSSPNYGSQGSVCVHYILGEMMTDEFCFSGHVSHSQRHGIYSALLLYTDRSANVVWLDREDSRDKRWRERRPSQYHGQWHYDEDGATGSCSQCFTQISLSGDWQVLCQASVRINFCLWICNRQHSP